MAFRLLIGFTFPLFLLAASINQAEANSPLRWCLDHFPRLHEFDAKGWYPTGPSVDMMRELARRSHFELQISKQTPIARCLKDLASGETDVMVNLLHNEERARNFILIRFASRVPDQLYLPKSTTKPVVLLSQLNGLSLVVVRGFRLHPKLQSIADALPAGQIQYVDSTLNALKLVAKGRVDGALLSPDLVKTVMSGHADLANQLKTVKFNDDDVQPEDIFIALSRGLQHLDTEHKLRAALLEMQQDGTLQRILGDTVLH